MEREQLREWLREIGDSETPLDNEDEYTLDSKTKVTES
ncbi:hypothetical protein PC129_g20692 [Phytophthora cactorum]|uniref:Uncharacterized protein n=1 Tax=Phytophthora cactorum TaxID=29920 RepID=A0A329T2R1_9STRA|nr:hypothetical protein Pcac1_g17455 [Phytophthora cactorum]KAG2799772.1 hypothetical protein PC112_g20761 [Phytophthora cactorum]KAG2800514.1 hypothetical protein PC111_g19940 [Phytophthora cactorum]KAG2829013.1 hypothetical protein PC113_g21358 [Phytophthora cactorum]KAG2884963.1 hypothetical protein PC115_g21152 [Phytophthora cactorum]